MERITAEAILLAAVVILEVLHDLRALHQAIFANIVAVVVAVGVVMEPELSSILTVVMMTYVLRVMEAGSALTAEALEDNDSFY